MGHAGCSRARSTKRAPAARPPPGRSALEGPPPSRPRPRAQPACTSAFGQADRLLLVVGATLVRCSKLQVFRRPSENVLSECTTCRISRGFSVTIQQRPIAANALCSTIASSVIRCISPSVIGCIASSVIGCIASFLLINSKFAAIGRCWIVTENASEIRHVVHSPFSTIQNRTQNTHTTLTRVNISELPFRPVLFLFGFGLLCLFLFPYFCSALV